MPKNTVVVDNLTYSEAMIRRMESAMAKMYEQEQEIRKLLLPLISVREPDPPDTLTVVKRYMEERGEIAVRLVENMGFQGASDLRRARNEILELRERNMVLAQGKQLVLIQFCDDILTLLSEFGYATPEKKYDSPSMVLSDLRNILAMNRSEKIK